MFRNFIRSNRWKSFAHSFGRHSSRVAQQDFNATVVDYIAELESQIEELSRRLDELDGGVTPDIQFTREAFARYQEGRPIAKRPRRPMNSPRKPESETTVQEEDDE